MTDTELTGSPQTFDLIGAIEGTTFPQAEVPFLFDAEAANAVGNMKSELHRLAMLGRTDEHDALEEVYFNALEALKAITFRVTVKSVPRKVKKAVLAEADAKYPSEFNPLTGVEKQNFDKLEFYNLLNWRAHIVKFEDPSGKVVEGPLDKDLVEKLLDNAPEASIAAVSAAIEELETGAKSGYEEAVRNLDFLSQPSPEESPVDTPQPSE